jgi:hypothetical protein
LTKIKIDKKESACRQIKTAIHLLSKNGDPIAIYVLASGAFRILRDLAEKAENNSAVQKFKDFIKPEMEGKFWYQFNSAYNFMKHADKNTEEIIEFDVTLNEFALMLCCIYWVSLSIKPTTEMVALFVWFNSLNPGYLLPDNPFFSELTQINSRISCDLNRPEKIEMLHKLLLIHNAM